MSPPNTFSLDSHHKKKSLTIVNCCSVTETTRVRNQTENIQCNFVHHKYIISATIPWKPCSKNYVFKLINTLSTVRTVNNGINELTHSLFSSDMFPISVYVTSKWSIETTWASHKIHARCLIKLKLAVSPFLKGFWKCRRSNYACLRRSRQCSGQKKKKKTCKSIRLLQNLLNP